MFMPTDSFRSILYFAPWVVTAGGEMEPMKPLKVVSSIDLFKSVHETANHPAYNGNLEVFECKVQWGSWSNSKRTLGTPPLERMSPLFPIVPRLALEAKPRGARPAPIEQAQEDIYELINNGCSDVFADLHDSSAGTHRSGDGDDVGLEEYLAQLIEAERLETGEEDADNYEEPPASTSLARTAPRGLLPSRSHPCPARHRTSCCEPPTPTGCSTRRPS